MAGFLFGFPSLRFPRRFRFFDTTVRPFAPWLLRWLTARARGLRQVQSRLDEAEFPTASQSALFEWALNYWRAADGASLDALRRFNNWTKRKDQHELLFNWETLAPLARWLPNPWQRPPAASAGRNERAEKDKLAAAPPTRVVSEKKRRSRKRHSGSGLPHSLETAQRKRKQPRAMARNLRDQHANLNGLKLLPRGCTLVTCLSTQPRAIFLN